MTVVYNDHIALFDNTNADNFWFLTLHLGFGVRGSLRSHDDRPICAQPPGWGERCVPGSVVQMGK
jgi:hypothetical protein